MGVRLACDDCGKSATSALFYRGPREHSCKVCGGHLSLLDPTQERRIGEDRRQSNERAAAEADWRTGEDRRDADA